MAAQRDLFGKAKRYVRPRNELAHCYALMEWARQQQFTRPELACLFHIPNGGHRFKQVGASLKRQGVKPGVPDYFLPVPRGEYHGLFIEMKDCDPGKEEKLTTDAQKRWLRWLGERGYCARPCPSWDRARELIEWYLDWPHG